jgi:hypothetical protein
VKRVKAGSYIVLLDGEPFAEVNCTGRPGVDDYPWGWHTVAPHPADTGHADTKRAAVDAVLAAAVDRAPTARGAPGPDTPAARHGAEPPATRRPTRAGPRDVARRDAGAPRAHA